MNLEEMLTEGEREREKKFEKKQKKIKKKNGKKKKIGGILFGRVNGEIIKIKVKRKI